MSRSVHNNFELLRTLVILEPKPRFSLLRAADKSLVTAICECALNVLNGNIELSSDLRRVLFTERDSLRALAWSKVKYWKSTRNIIMRKSKLLIPLLVKAGLEHLGQPDSSKEVIHTNTPDTVINKLNINNNLLDPVPTRYHCLEESTTIVGNGKNKRRARKVCKSCCERENDRIQIQNMNKVTTFCAKCPSQPYLCGKCFEETHTQHRP